MSIFPKHSGEENAFALFFSFKLTLLHFFLYLVTFAFPFSLLLSPKSHFFLFTNLYIFEFLLMIFPFILPLRTKSGFPLHCHYFSCERQLLVDSDS